MADFKERLAALRNGLKSPLDKLMERQQLLDELVLRFHSTMRQNMNFTKERFSSLVSRLDALSPLAVLSRGYSLSVRIEDSEIIKDAKILEKGDLVKTVIERELL